MIRPAQSSESVVALSTLASDRFTGSIDEQAVRKALDEAREAGRKAQDYLLSRVKPESNIRYR